MIEGSIDRARSTRRHPAEVTAERVSEHIAAYTDHLTPTEVGILDRTCRILGEVPERVRLVNGGDDQ